jgi:ABC-2 type transport system permease protein
MWKFIQYELRHWIKSPMTWIFLLINTLLVMGAVSSDTVQIGGGVGSVHKNAPYVIQTYYGVMSLVCLLMTTAFMNATANRDFQHGMYQFVFTSPIKKRDYYFGKFIGATIVSVFPLLGVSLGALIGPLMPWADDARYGDVIWSGHTMGLFTFGIPNTIIAGVWLYVLAIIFRSNMVSFIGAMLILVFYAVSQGFTRDLEKEWLANILDPFGFRPQNIAAKYLTVDEKNIAPVPLSGALLNNRAIWIVVSGALLFLCYFLFSFSAKRERSKKKKTEADDHVVYSGVIASHKPQSAGSFRPGTFIYMLRHETRAIIRNPTFIIIVVIGLINLIASITSFTGRYGGDQYPVTYDVVDSIRNSFYLFIVAIITFYTGVLVWRERDAGISEIQDATPVKTGMLFGSKLLAMIMALTVVLLSSMVIGIIAQVCYRYTRFELGVYLKSLLVLDLSGFSFLVVIALLFHYLINNRYIAYFAFVMFVILNSFLWGALQIETNMVDFAGTPNVIYSDMNGFGPFVKSTTWFTIYWFLFCMIVGFVIFAFYVRGKEAGFSHRVRYAKQAFGKTRLSLGAFVLLYFICTGFVYYNTKVLNTYDTSKELEESSAEYERKYKKYEGLNQPRFYRFDYNIDIDPEARNLHALTTAWARNISDKNIDDLHFTVSSEHDSVALIVPGSSIKLNDTQQGYRIYKLDKPLQPGDSIMITVNFEKLNKGFENEVSFKQLTQNGTFFNNVDIFPKFGYQDGYEISDKNKRTKYKLPKKRRMPPLDEKNLKARANTYIANDADWVDVRTVISTSPDQIAIAPGSLVKSWTEGNKKYFAYHLDHRSLNFYSFVSAKYEIARQKWNGIDLEVYYVKQHAYNVPNMLRSMERSLEYYTKNFGPYPHKQCRIIEFPRYASFAQAFPGTMPYSESIGFIADLRDVTKDDIDQVYYVVAHEMGHQYWAHQLIGADMQGSELMSEGFAQYSALMVMEKEYGKDKMKKFLKYEMDGYLRGRGGEFEAERPLVKTEHQAYIHYQKASVVLYYLKELIGEEKVNSALRSLIDSFAYKGPPFPTSRAAVRAFRRVTPDSLQYAIDDMFENITLFSNRVMEVSYHKVGEEYEVSIETSSEKFRADSLGKETAIPISDYIDIGIFAEPEKKKTTGEPLLMRRVKITDKTNTFVFRVKEQPYQAGIDPYNYLVDRIPDDNLKMISKK